MIRIGIRMLRLMAVTVWFGGWFFTPLALLVLTSFDDPRDPFPELFSLVGAIVLAGGALYIIVFFALFDELPPFLTD